MAETRNMTRLAMAGALLVLAMPLTEAGAQQARTAAKSPTLTGIDKIHDQVAIGGKVCMADHDHRGEGSMPSRKGAEGAAIRNWEIFTRDEYGSAWSRYQLAVAKSMQCRDSDRRWICILSARPCRPARI
jgi:hypothetical protein